MGNRCETVYRWTCDGCAAATTTASACLPRPQAYRAWAQIKWTQDDAFDYGGSSWANRIAGDGVLTLCDVCADRVYAAIKVPRG